MENRSTCSSKTNLVALVVLTNFSYGVPTEHCFHTAETEAVMRLIALILAFFAGEISKFLVSIPDTSRSNNPRFSCCLKLITFFVNIAVLPREPVLPSFSLFTQSQFFYFLVQVSRARKKIKKRQKTNTTPRERGGWLRACSLTLA